MKVKEALDEINSVWDKLPTFEKKSVKDHWFWAVEINGLKPDDEINEFDWRDILDHIKWFYPRPSDSKPAVAE